MHLMLIYFIGISQQHGRCVPRVPGWSSLSSSQSYHHPSFTILSFWWESCQEQKCCHQSDSWASSGGTLHVDTYIRRFSIDAEAAFWFFCFPSFVQAQSFLVTPLSRMLMSHLACEGCVTSSNMFIPFLSLFFPPSSDLMYITPQLLLRV